MPSAVLAWAATGRPAPCAAATPASQLGLVKVGAARLAGPPAIVGVEFDHVGAGRRSGRGRRATISSAPSASSAPCGIGDAGLEALGAVGAVRDDRAGGDQQARAGNDALVDRLLEADIGEAGALGAEVARGGEAGHRAWRRRGRRRGRCAARAARAAPDRPTRLVVGMEEEVRMALDHPRHQGHAGKVDGARAGGGG